MMSKKRLEQELKAGDEAEEESTKRYEDKTTEEIR